VETIACFLSISPNKYFFFIGLGDDDEALFSCLSCLIFSANSNVFTPVLLLTVVSIIGESSLEDSSMKLKPSVDDDDDEEDGSLIV